MFDFKQKDKWHGLTVHDKAQAYMVPSIFGKTVYQLRRENVETILVCACDLESDVSRVCK